MDIPVAFRTWQTPAQNSAAWTTAVNAIPPNGARLILPDGEFHPHGLVMAGNVNTTIVGGVVIRPRAIEPACSVTCLGCTPCTSLRPEMFM
jgi:hypothetical protein